MHRTDVTMAATVFLLWIACAPPEDRATTNDGDPCTQGGDCDSRRCEADGRCGGSHCEKDEGCREGWRCLRRTNVLGRTSGVCVSGDGGATAPETVTIESVAPPREQWLSLRAGDEVKLRVATNEGARVVWKIAGGAAAESFVTYEGIETSHVFATPADGSCR